MVIGAQSVGCRNQLRRVHHGVIILERASKRKIDRIVLVHGISSFYHGTSSTSLIKAGVLKISQNLKSFRYQAKSVGTPTVGRYILCDLSSIFCFFSLPYGLKAACRDCVPWPRLKPWEVF